jgi:hypothetical protein
VRKCLVLSVTRVSTRACFAAARMGASSGSMTASAARAQCAGGSSASSKIQPICRSGTGYVGDITYPQQPVPGVPGRGPNLR